MRWRAASTPGREGARVVVAGAGGVAPEAERAHAPKRRRIVGAAENEQGARVAGLGGAFKDGTPPIQAPRCSA